MKQITELTIFTSQSDIKDEFLFSDNLIFITFMCFAFVTMQYKKYWHTYPDNAISLTKECFFKQKNKRCLKNLMVVFHKGEYQVKNKRFFLKIKLKYILQFINNFVISPIRSAQQSAKNSNCIYSQNLQISVIRTWYFVL